jgi:uncharacterized protein YecE (DUF72 family)
MSIRIGCSGWSYDDWVGPFYPRELANKKGEWFAYYAKYFNTVEINSSFYRPPGELQVKSWIKKAPKGFEYSAKMPRLVTHKALVDENLKNAVFWAAAFERTCVGPLADAGLLGSVLLQLSPYFKNSDHALSDLKGLLDALPTYEHNYSVEFRHRSWLDESKKEMDSETLETLRERNVANVLLDAPGQPATREQTVDHAYIRFHGRNADIWFGLEKEVDHRLDRYDYLYEEKQLEPWVPRINEAVVKAANVRIYFNNHARAKAIKNAFQLMDMILWQHGHRNKHKDIKLQNQFKLSEF